MGVHARVRRRVGMHASEHMRAYVRMCSCARFGFVVCDGHRPLTNPELGTGERRVGLGVQEAHAGTVLPANHAPTHANALTHACTLHLQDYDQRFQSPKAAL